MFLVFNTNESETQREKLAMFGSIRCHKGKQFLY